MHDRCFEQENFPQMRTPQEDLDGIGSTGEEYRRALRSVILQLHADILNDMNSIFLHPSTFGFSVNQNWIYIHWYLLHVFGQLHYGALYNYGERICSSYKFQSKNRYC